MNAERIANIGPVLFIDDDESYRKSTTKFLESKGFTVVGMPTALHACKFIQNQPWNWYPSIIITDIVMSGMGGYEFIRRIEDMYPKREIPTIVISKLTGNIDILEAESAGAIAYVTKPVDPEKVFNVLVKILSSKRKRMQLFTANTQV